MLGTAFSDEFTSDSSSEIFTGGAGADVITLGDGSGTDRITDFDISTDKLEIVQNVNDTAITGASSALSRITDTSDGALVNLGYSGTGSEQVQHTILLEGVSKDSLSSDNFLVPEIL
jgi:Ca2+-binding RTX toxin-like protein